MEQTELLAYLRRFRLGVLGTVSPEGQPQAALVGYAVSADFDILFDTVRPTRKYRNLTANGAACFTVGSTSPLQPEEITVQIEGIASELLDGELERLRPVYYAAWPEGNLHEAWPDICWWRLRPRWIRYTAYEPDFVQEWRFP